MLQFPLMVVDNVRFGLPIQSEELLLLLIIDLVDIYRPVNLARNKRQIILLRVPLARLRQLGLGREPHLVLIQVVVLLRFLIVLLLDPGVVLLDRGVHVLTGVL